MQKDKIELEKWIPPTRLETAKIGKKIEEILGVKDENCKKKTFIFL